MIELNLDKINSNDWRHYLKDSILTKGKSSVEYQAKRFGYASIIYYSDEGEEIMEGYYMCAGQCISMIRVTFSKSGRAKSFSVYM